VCVHFSVLVVVTPRYLNDFTAASGHLVQDMPGRSTRDLYPSKKFPMTTTCDLSGQYITPFSFAHPTMAHRCMKGPQGRMQCEYHLPYYKDNVNDTLLDSTTPQLARTSVEAPGI
jgi:hypothetical protein